LLPMLIKKIPTFDYAVLFCEGHDKTQMLRGGQIVEVNTMRDNVVFEIGLCAMALGLSKVILVTDANVRLPEDLHGVNNELALKHISCLEPGSGDVAVQIQEAAREIDRYIRATQNDVSPVVIGAAASTASGFVVNFISRSLEKIHEGIVLMEEGWDEKEQEKKYIDVENISVPVEKIHMRVVFPKNFASYKSGTPRTYMRQFKRAKVAGARSRAAEFAYEIVGDEFYIYDAPTTLATSYSIASMILKINADDEEDPQAEERFIGKEIELFESTLHVLMNREYLQNEIERGWKFEKVSEADKQLFLENVLSVIQNRFEIIRV